MAAATHHWTATELATLPDDGNRYEIIDGELLVTPAPAWKHQELVHELGFRLSAYLRPLGLARVIQAPADIELADDTVVEPDLFVVPLVGGRGPERWSDVRRLLLAVEVLSPSTARVDRTIKRTRYQRAGFPEYWIVDGASRVVERWRPADERPEVLTERITWHPDGAAEPLAIDLAALFSEVLGPVP